MTYAESILNSNITEVAVYENLKFYTGEISNMQSIVKSLNQHGCYIIAAESDIHRRNPLDGALMFAIGDKLCIGSIINEDDGEYHRRVQRKTVLTYVGVDTGFVILDTYSKKTT